MIARYIKAEGLKQVAIANRIGEDESWLSRRLKGTVPLSVEDLVRISKALGVSPCAFFEEEGGNEVVGNIRRLEDAISRVSGISKEELRSSGYGVLFNAPQDLAERAAVAAVKQAEESLRAVVREELAAALRPEQPPRLRRVAEEPEPYPDAPEEEG